MYDKLRSGLIGFAIGLIFTSLIGTYLLRKYDQKPTKIEVREKIVEVKGKDIVKTQIVERVVTKTEAGETVTERIVSSVRENEFANTVAESHSKNTTAATGYKNLLSVSKGISLEDKDYILTAGRQMLFDGLFLTGSYLMEEKKPLIGVTFIF